MNEILDEIEIKANKTRFSKLSLITSLVTLGTIVYLYLSIPRAIKVSEGEGILEYMMMMIIAILIFCLIGLTMTILSFKKKEPSNWFKWVGGVLNIILFLLIAGSVIFARLI